LEYSNITAGIAFPFLYCHAGTLITDFVYALFLPHAIQVCEWNISWKVLEKGFLSPGKPWNLVFASPGKSWKKSISMSVRNLKEHGVIPVTTFL